VSRTQEESEALRFGFGKNWENYLRRFNEERLASAVQSIANLLGAQSLHGKSFLDAGCGSGLFSLAARSMGAKVHSIDYDPDSVACTTALKQARYPGDADWTIEQGSVLSDEFMNDARQYDIVYSWGVLHHTGDMWRAVDNVMAKTRRDGRLIISIYNDQGWLSTYWKIVKKAYNRNQLARFALIAVYAPYHVGARYAFRVLTGRAALERGMSYWYDMLDWLGGTPFEVAEPAEVFDHVHGGGFELQRLRTVGCRAGCNEFVFSRKSAKPSSTRLPA